MIAKKLAAAGLGLLLIGSAAGIALAGQQAAAPAAKAAPAKPAAKAAAPACNRACLEGLAEQYLAALGKRDPKAAPFARGARYSENGVELTMPDGLWRTAGGIGPYRLFVTEPGQGVGVFATATENGAPIIVATRLKVVGRQITLAESVVSRQEVGGATNPAARPAPMTQTRPQFLQTLRPSERRSRMEMIRIADSYFEGLELNTGDQIPPFHDTCLRIENGNQTSSRPLAAGATRTGANYNCRESIELGYYRDDTRLRDRRYLLVDQERGLVYSMVYFDHDAVMRSYQLKNGETINIARTAPWTWAIHEIFQIRDGKIDQVEAVLLGVPYGMRPAFRDGVTMPSHGR